MTIRMQVEKVHIASKLLPFFILLSILLHVASMYVSAWLRGYYGDVSVTSLSPWYLCNVECLQCPDTVPKEECFVMENWAHTQYDVLGVIQYLEYWCLGALTLSLIPSAILACGYLLRSHHCGVDIRRPALLFLGVAAILSVLALSLFSQASSHPSRDVTNYGDLRMRYGPGWYLRMLAAVVTCLTACVGVGVECRSGRKADDEGYMVVTQPRTIEEVMEDENEEDGQLL